MSASHDDFDFEPQRGLPQILPPGERLLWQGAPRWQDLAIHAFHARKVVWYFAGLALLTTALRLAEGASLTIATQPFTWLMTMGLLAAALLTALAWLSARTTIYTITSKRIVLRIGMALPVSINLPFRQIDGASLRLFGNGSGDIPIKITRGERVAYLLLWPHARPFHFASPQPCLRCVAKADDIASLLANALSGNQVPALGMAPDQSPASLPPHAAAA